MLEKKKYMINEDEELLINDENNEIEDSEEVQDYVNQDIEGQDSNLIYSVDSNKASHSTYMANSKKNI